jgi:hypothetical protein
MVFKMKGWGNDKKDTEGVQVSQEDFKTWANKEIKTGKYTKNEKGTWVDNKNRNLRQVYQGVQGVQRK